MFLPIHTDRPLRRKPVVNLALIAANILVYLLQFQFPAMESALLLRPHEPTLLAFFGSAFMHARQDMFHIAGNMLFLYIFGNSINDRLGHLPYLGFYLGGALTAGILHVLLADAPVLGASGAVAAVTGAYLVLFPRSRVAVLIFLFIVTVAYIPSLYFVGLFFVIDLIRAFGTSFLGTQSPIASFAHLGGTFYGAGVGMLLMAANLVPRDQMDLLAIIRRHRLRKEHERGLRQMGQMHRSAHDIVPAGAADPAVNRVQDLREAINAALADDDLRLAARRYVELLRLDAAQVLAGQPQLDVANQLTAERRFPEAAAAYELFLSHHPTHPEHARTQLMLGLVYARYLARPAEARRHLQASSGRLADESDLEIARRELSGLEGENSGVAGG